MLGVLGKINDSEEDNQDVVKRSRQTYLIRSNIIESKLMIDIYDVHMQIPKKKFIKLYYITVQIRNIYRKDTIYTVPMKVIMWQYKFPTYYIPEL